MKSDIRQRLITKLRRPRPGTWQPTVGWHLRAHQSPYSDTYDAWTLLAEIYADETGATWSGSVLVRQVGKIKVEVGKLDIQLWADLSERLANKIDKLTLTYTAEDLALYLSTHK